MSNENQLVPTCDLAEDDLLQHCPWCDYSLRGLPVEHRCPECGGEFDRRWEVFECDCSDRLDSLRPPRYWIRAIVLWLIGATLCQWLLHATLGHVLIWIETTLRIPADNLLIAALVLLFVWFHRRHRMGFIALSPLHLVIGNRERMTFEIALWKDVSEAQKISWSRMLIRFCNSTSRFDRVRFRNECVTRINDRVDDYYWLQHPEEVS